MKYSTILLYFILILSFCEVYSQTERANTGFEKYYMQKDVDLTYQEILQMKMSEFIQYSDAFKYYKELSENRFIIDSNEKEIFISFISSKERITTANFSAVNGNNKITYIKGKANVNGAIYKTLTLKGEEKEFIDFSRAINRLKTRLNFDNKSSFPVIIYIYRPKILFDKEILNFPEYGNYGKILNRSVAAEHLRDENNQPCHLFADATDGALLTFNWNEQTSMAKVFTVDQLWSRVLWFDQIFTSPMTGGFGQMGNGIYEFKFPTGIVRANAPNEYYSSGHHYFDYSIYVADKGNDRIVKFIYQIVDSLGGWARHIKPNSFTNLFYTSSPYDLDLFPGADSLSDSDDILWYGSFNSFGLYALKPSTGEIVSQFESYIYNGEARYILPSRISVYKSPDGQANLLACIDRNENAILFFKLNPDGTMPDNTTPVASSAYKFNSSESAMSIKLLSTNPNFGVSAYVVTDNRQSWHVNVFKVNLLDGCPFAEYLASYYKGYGSDLTFKELHNLVTQDGYPEVFTLERWDNTYGIRRYKPGLDTLFTDASNYNPVTKSINMKIRVTRNASIDGHLEYFDGTNLHVYALNFSGLPMFGNNHALTAGTNIFSLTNINLPNSTVKGNAAYLKLIYDLCPLGESVGTSNNLFIIQRNITVGNPPPVGGCPFLYVYNGNDMLQDNNILHRSEFDDFKGNDITDKYKLNITPYFNPADSVCTLVLRELNNDFSYLDKIELKAIDHPAGTLAGITENKDVILYLPQYIENTDKAMQNDSVDVTCNLQYDTLCLPVKGDSSDVITSIMSNGAKKNLLTKQGALSKFFNPMGFIKNLKGTLEDSIAVILEAGTSESRGNIQVKYYAGTIDAFNGKENYSSGEKSFARRENNSVVIIPVSRNIPIDSIYMNWDRSYNISFLCTIPVYYGGYIEKDMQLICADNPYYGNVTSLLTAKDNNYANLDINGDLNLNFKAPYGEVPEGWVRDYVLITDGRYEYIERKSSLTKVNGNNLLPTEYKLYQNYPNPFNPVSVIKYDVPKTAFVKISIFDILGREIKFLVNEQKQPGYYQIQFDGTNFASGVYFYRIISGDYNQTKRMVLVK